MESCLAILSKEDQMRNPASHPKSFNAQIMHIIDLPIQIAVLDLLLFLH